LGRIVVEMARKGNAMSLSAACKRYLQK